MTRYLVAHRCRTRMKKKKMIFFWLFVWCEKNRNRNHTKGNRNFLICFYIPLFIHSFSFTFCFFSPSLFSQRWQHFTMISYIILLPHRITTPYYHTTVLSLPSGKYRQLNIKTTSQPTSLNRKRKKKHHKTLHNKKQIHNNTVKKASY
jgi:hypothetical protein